MASVNIFLYKTDNATLSLHWKLLPGPITPGAGRGAVQNDLLLDVPLLGHAQDRVLCSQPGDTCGELKAFLAHLPSEVPWTELVL